MVKLAAQNLHCKFWPNGAQYIQRWLILIAYGNIPLPYPTVPPSTPRGIHSKGVVYKSYIQNCCKIIMEI